MRGVVGGGRPLPFLPTNPQRMNVPARRMKPRRFAIDGITRDSAGDPLSDCTVDLFEAQNPKVIRAQVVSGIEGAFRFDATEGLAHRLVAKKLSGDRFSFYFHTETTLNGAPTAPTGCATLSENDPEQPSLDSLSGHVASSGTGDRSQLNKPFAADNTSVAGLPPTTATPDPLHQFGWFTDAPITGTFQAGQWLLRFRSQDIGAGITGRPTVNIYATTGRNFSSTRFLAQFESTTDWWGGNTATESTASDLGQFVMANEYLFVQVWCHEVDTFAPGNSLAMLQEGVELADDQRMRLITAPLTVAGQIPVAGATFDNLIGVPA